MDQSNKSFEDQCRWIISNRLLAKLWIPTLELHLGALAFLGILLKDVSGGAFLFWQLVLEQGHRLSLQSCLKPQCFFLSWLAKNVAFSKLLDEMIIPTNFPNGGIQANSRCLASETQNSSSFPLKIASTTGCSG